MTSIQAMLGERIRNYNVVIAKDRIFYFILIGNI